MSVLDMNTYKLGFELKEQHSRGESNSPGFYIFCKRQFMKFYLFLFLFSPLFFIYKFLGIPYVPGKANNKRSENEVDKEIITFMSRSTPLCNLQFQLDF